jgi:hypothetical protein
MSTVVFIAMWLLPALILGAACRERGTAHKNFGTQKARAIIWGLPVALVYIFVHWLSTSMLDTQTGLYVWCGAYLGFALAPHGAGQDLNVPWTTSDDETDGFKRMARPERMGYLMTAWLCRGYFVALPLWLSGGYTEAMLVVPLVAGLMAPLAYLAGLVAPKLPITRLDEATEWGELLSGAGFGLAMTLGLQMYSMGLSLR